MNAIQLMTIWNLIKWFAVKAQPVLVDGYEQIKLTGVASDMTVVIERIKNEYEDDAIIWSDRSDNCVVFRFWNAEKV